WSTDGATGTKRIGHFDGTSGTVSMEHKVDYNGKLAFRVDYHTAFASTPPYAEIWLSDGTAAGTMLINDAGPEIVNVGAIATAGGSLYFTANNNTELWKSDGTFAGTAKVTTAPPSSTFEGEFVASGNNLYFTGS